MEDAREQAFMGMDLPPERVFRRALCAGKVPSPQQVRNPFVTLWQPAHGGHVGFTRGRLPGHVRAMPDAVGEWLAAQAGAGVLMRPAAPAGAESRHG